MSLAGLRPLRVSATVRVGAASHPARLEGLDGGSVAFLVGQRLWPGDAGDILCHLPGAPGPAPFPFRVRAVAEVPPRTWRIHASFQGLGASAQAALTRFLHPGHGGGPVTHPPEPTEPTAIREVPTSATGPTLVPLLPTDPVVRPSGGPGATHSVRLVTADWRGRALQIVWPTRESLAEDWHADLRTGGLRVPAPSPPPPLGLALQITLSPPSGESIRTIGSVGALRDQQALIQIQLRSADLSRLRQLIGP